MNVAEWRDRERRWREDHDHLSAKLDAVNRAHQEITRMHATELAHMRRRVAELETEIAHVTTMLGAAIREVRPDDWEKTTEWRTAQRRGTRPPRPPT